ncbi:hypothetical protein FRC03_000375 [Tulasnella sp. 419]|nr:hypothetical protein FRC02_000370 [Tulasnella sp. 418]KAG8949343.1 hypothetical protein FRC03_000375 [Tulasnella sp. 419]
MMLHNLNTSSITQHFIALSFIAPGHIKPLVSLAVNLARKQPSLLFTILAHTDGYGLIKNELGLNLNSDGIVPGDAEFTDLVARIPIISIASGASQGFEAVIRAPQEIADAVTNVYPRIIAGGEVGCLTTQDTFNFQGVPPPTLVIDDLFNAPAGYVVKKITPNVKMVQWFVSSATHFIRRNGPARIGGQASWEEDVKAIVAADPSKDFMEVAASLYLSRKGDVVKIPGLPELYDYELDPQDFPLPPIAPMLMGGTRIANNVADGSIITCLPGFEPEASSAIRSWYEDELGQRAFMVGHQLPRSYYSPSSTDISTNVASSDPVISFLNKIHSSHGSKSLVYISFGTVWYPAGYPNHITALLSSLIETSTPFLFARAPIMFAPIPKEIEEQAISSGLGYFADWAPQAAVLSHPVLQAFVTHGGANSVFESLTKGVVNIFWPFHADQPQLAAYLTQKLDASFELVQIRTGVAAAPTRSGIKVEGTDEAIKHEIKQILSDLKGEVGDRKRKNVLAVQKMFRESVQTGGEADLALGSLLEYGV